MILHHNLGGNLDINSKYITGTGGVNVTGVVTATSFVGNVTGNTSGTAGGLSGTPDITVNNIVAVGATFSGVVTYEDVTNIDSIGIVTARSGLEIGAGSITTIIKLDAAIATTTTTSESNIDTFDASIFRSAQYQIQITRGSLYHVTTLNVLHDGTDVYMSEFGTIKTGSTLATFDADIDSGNVRVRATPAFSSSTAFKISKTLTKV